jgi:enoyl-CoA hydratase
MNVKLSREGSIAKVVIDRPEVRNALNEQMLLDLRAMFHDISRSPDILVVTITGTGETFSAGADIKERVGRDKEWIRQRRHLGFATYQAIASCEIPVLAAVNGLCIGAGCEIILASDFVVASERATFRYPEILLGSVGATQRLPRAVGKAMAKELLFTGRVVSAEEAKSIGLVNRVVPHEKIDLHVEELVGQIAAMPTNTIRLLKRCVDLGAETDLERGLSIERMAIDQALAGDDWKERIEEFSR